MVRPLEDRFLEKVEPELNTGCLLWGGVTNHKGYGLITIRKGYARSTHRVAWEMENGPIPGGLFVCHKCDTPACVNPNHLFLGTNRDNIVDMYRKGRAPVGADRRKPTNTKLSEREVQEIRRIYSSGVGYRPIARQYGVAHSLISRIVKGKAWPQ